VEHDGRWAGEAVRGGPASGVAERAHPRGARSLDAVAAVLDHRATRCVGGERGSGVEEQVGGGLAVADVVGAEDAAVEALEQPGQAERVPQLVVAAARGDAVGTSIASSASTTPSTGASSAANASR
jgi:hypothetical protein